MRHSTLKFKGILASAIMLALSIPLALAGTITDTYTTGDTLTTTTLDHIKTAVNDNDTAISTLEGLHGITSYLSIPARSGFQPLNNDASFGSCFPNTFAWNGTGSSVFVAPVTLPNNATITGFTYYFWRSSSATLETTATLYRQAIPATVSREAIASYTSTASDPNHTSGDGTIDVTMDVVDNQNYTYYIEADLPGSSGSLCVDGARITYTAP